jgi:thiopeptide-type bacteriocin biosynthesis protein
VDIPPWPDLTGTTSEHVAAWRRWLQQVWADEAFTATIEVASPVLARSVRHVCKGDTPQVRRVRRTVESIVRYLLRSTSRATPFGLFAGVAAVRFAPEMEVRFGADHQAIARVDSVWLAELIARLEGYPPLLRRLPVMLNNLCTVRDGRLVVGCQQQPNQATQAAAAEVSVRRTRPVAAVVQAAGSPILLGDLLDKLLTDFPGTPQPVIEKMLAELVAQRILITSLRPPMTTSDPLGHVVAALAAVGAHQEPQAAELVGQLRDIHTGLSRHNRASSPTAARILRSCVAQKMATILANERPVSVDLRLDADLTLPQVVAAEAERAAAALTRLTPYPFGVAAWKDFHRRVLDRYGIGALVPVLELTNADTGLGFPAGYRNAHLEPSARPLSDRDARLLALAQQAALDHSIEIVLDDQVIADLTGVDFAAVQVRPHTDLCVRVHAPTPDAIQRGEFELAVVGASRAAGTTTGRFLDLLGPADRDRMASAYAELPTINPGAMPVQVACPPLSARTENVARSPAVLPHLVHIAEHPTCGDGVIPLADLAVGADTERLYLVSVSRRQVVEATVFNAVEFTTFTHPLARFLCEVSKALAASCNPFFWGAASSLPFLPRIRYGRTILDTARWRLTASDLPGRTAPWPTWVQTLAAWRRRYGIPQVVYLGTDDRRLRLDLDEPTHLHLLRNDLERAGQVTLHEAEQDGAFGWCGGRIHEIVIPLAATAQPIWRPIPPRTCAVRTISREHGHLPAASPWLFAALYGHPDRCAAILTAHLPALLAAWDRPPPWWFLRYADPEPHLRLRIRLPVAETFGQVAARVGAWAAELRRLGLIGRLQFDTYFPETGRFGFGAASTAAEAVFAADSAAVLAQLTHAAGSGAPHPQALTVASMVDLATSYLGSLEVGMRWLLNHIVREPGPTPARDLLSQAMQLANPRDGWAQLRTVVPGGQAVTTAWARRRTALASYRTTLNAAVEITPESVLPSLLHLHHLRMAGPHAHAERACLRLARAAALAWISQPHGGTGVRRFSRTQVPTGCGCPARHGAP